MSKFLPYLLPALELLAGLFLKRKQLSSGVLPCDSTLPLHGEVCECSMCCKQGQFELDLKDHLAERNR